MMLSSKPILVPGLKTVKDRVMTALVGTAMMVVMAGQIFYKGARLRLSLVK